MSCTGIPGTINLQPHPDSGRNSLVYVPLHQPNHFGRPPSSVDGGVVEVRLTGINGRLSSAMIDVAGVAGAGILVIEGARETVEWPLDDIKAGMLNLSLDGLAVESELRWTVRTDEPDEIGYVVFREIRLEVGAD